jgi:hypothetical protein
MHFGLNNAGATFQRLMDLCRAGLIMEICLVVVFLSATPEEHLQILQVVLQRIGD